MLRKDNLSQDIFSHLSFSKAICVIIAAVENTMCYQAFNENENRVDVHYQVFIQDRPTRKVEIF